MTIIKSLKRNQSGQTLIEVIIAIAVLAFAMGSAGSLAAATTRVSTESGRRTQATALASRELEALRSLRDALAENTNEPRTLGQYFAVPGRANTVSGGCVGLIMVEDNSSGNGWRTTGVGTVVAFAATDFGGGTSVEGVDNYRRMVRVCPGNDYDAIGATSVQSAHLYDIEVRVEWSEAGGPQRELIYRTMLSTPRGAHFE